MRQARVQAIPTVVTIATFSLYVLLGHELTATRAFTALSLFAVLRNPLFQLPMVITQATRAAVAIRRLRVRTPVHPGRPLRHACASPRSHARILHRLLRTPL